MTAAPILKTQNLSIGPSGIPLCAGMDFALQPGRITALLGRNGSGKTTLLLTLAGLRDPLGGAVTIAGESLEQIPPRLRAKRVALMLSPRNLGENLRGRELVELGRWPHTPWHGRLTEDDHEKVRAAMDQTGTAIFADRQLGRLSDGERQKLAIARALAQEAGLLLLDEPLSHLDAPTRRDMLLLLRRLAETQGKAILFSCHDLDLAFRHAHECLALLPGAEWKTGTPEAIATDPDCRNNLGWDG